MVNFKVATYQSYCVCEEPLFRELCLLLNKKTPHLRQTKLSALVKEEYQFTLLKVKKILSGREYSTDVWASLTQKVMLHALVILLIGRQGIFTTLSCIFLRKKVLPRLLML
jgi:hypothetical protein